MKKKNPNQPDFNWNDCSWNGDGAEGARRRDEGMEQVIENTPPYFQCLLSMVFWFLVDQGEPFTAETARPLSGDPPNHHNAFSSIWGHLGTKAKKLGLVEVIGITRALRPTSNRCILQIYRKKPNGVVVDLSYDEEESA